jgi:hypothetical protein
MRIFYTTKTSFLFHFLLIAGLVVAAIASFAEVRQPFLANGSVVEASVGSSSATSPILSYRWNLDDAQLPLLTLPDHVSGAVDLSLTYSMDQFQFPLFQSLYYSERAGKYILMVTRKDGVRTEFIDLTPTKVRNQFEAKGDSDLRLEEKGNVKMLTTSEGTIYTFAPFGAGEFHCSQIKDGHGGIINLKYTHDAAIDSIVDVSGRTINFGYEDEYLKSITQTWGPGSIKKQTWVIANLIGTGAAVNPALAGTATVKHIPSNALSPVYTQAMATSDATLAAIFGGPGAVAAANGFEPVGLASQYPLYRGDLIGDDGIPRRGHLSFAMHLYGSVNGTADNELYVPAGFTSHSNTPTPTDAAITFYYPRLGNLTDVTLAVFHVANFHLSNEGARVRIGNIGGPGGSNACYKHSHIEFYRGDTGLPPAASRPQLRIDPATVFETGSETVARNKIRSSAGSY